MSWSPQTLRGKDRRLTAAGVVGALLSGGCSRPSPTKDTAQPPPSQIAPSPTIDLEYIRRHGLLVMGDVSTPGTPLDKVSIFTVGADGTRKTTLTGPGNQYPSWTPDGRIIFVSNRSGSPQIWIMAADGTNARQIGDLQIGPVLEITRVQMAKTGLIAFRNGGDGIWLMEEDGSNLRRLVKFENGAGDAPSLAPSGTWLTYTAPADATPGHNEIFRINVDGTGGKQLTFAGDSKYPDGNASSISPDETKIAIYSGTESHAGDTGLTEWHNIGVIPADGGALQILTKCHPSATPPEPATGTDSDDDCVASDNPSWSPDGHWLVFDRGSLDPARGGTFTIDIDGNELQQLSTDYAGGGSAPLKFDD